MKKGVRTFNLTYIVIFILQPIYSHGLIKPDSLATNSQRIPMERKG